MAGPAFRTNGARAANASAATLSPAKPTVDGQRGILLAVVTSKNNAVHACGTAGWTNIASQNSGGSFTASLWIADESAGAPTFTWTGPVACSAQISYYSDPANSMNIGISVIDTPGTGTTSPHTSPAITTDADSALAVYIDVAAAATTLTAPAGWAQDVSNVSATDAGQTSFGSKSVASSGSSSGAISSTGAVAAWVQWQLELKGTAPTAGLQVSKETLIAWADTPDGVDVSKASLVAWLETADLRASRIELLAWLDFTGAAGGAIRRCQLIND